MKNSAFKAISHVSFILGAWRLWTLGASVSHSAGVIKADRDTLPHNHFYWTWVGFLLLEK